MCEQLQLFAEINYLASRQLWNLQTLKVPEANSWVVPIFSLQIRKSGFAMHTIHRNRLQDINPAVFEVSFFQRHQCWVERSCEALYNRVQVWWCFKGGQVEVRKKNELTRVMLRNWRLRYFTAFWWWKMPCSQWKGLMSLPWVSKPRFWAARP